MDKRLKMACDKNASYSSGGLNVSGPDSLKSRAKALGIPKYSMMNRHQLLELLCKTTKPVRRMPPKKTKRTVPKTKLEHKVTKSEQKVTQPKHKAPREDIQLRFGKFCADNKLDYNHGGLDLADLRVIARANMLKNINKKTREQLWDELCDDSGGAAGGYTVLVSLQSS